MKPQSIALLFFLCSSSAIAQSEAEAKFRELDKNNDNQISAAEAENAPWFKVADKNADGIVTSDEGRAFTQARNQAKKNKTTPSAKKTGTAGSEIKSKLDIRYHETPGVDAIHESLDLYYPVNSKKAPILVYVHGGGWRQGDKKAVGSKVEFYTSQGWLVASINYRLVPDGLHPNNVQDVANAIAWLHSNAAEHGGDPDRLILMGHSAGAHLVALVATGEKWLREAGKSLSIIQGVVELDTQALDVVRMMREGRNLTYENAFGLDETKQRDASPFEYVSNGKSIPPFLLIVAGSVQPKIEQAKAFQAKLREADVFCEFIEAPQHNHGSLNEAMGVVGDKTHEAVWKLVQQRAQMLESSSEPAVSKPLQPLNDR